MNQNNDNILKEMHIARLRFGILILSEMAAFAAFIYVKIVLFPEAPYWLLGIVLMANAIGMSLVLHRIFSCPNCKTKLIGFEGIKIFDDKCENCGTSFKQM